MRIRPTIALAIALSLAPALVHAEDELPLSCKERPGLVEITFKPELELKELIAWAMGFTCKNFMYDPRIVATNRKIVVVAPQKMTPAAAYDLFLVSLSTMNLVVVHEGPALRIVEAPAATKESLPIVTSSSGVPTAQVVRMVLRPTYAKPEAMKPALDALRSDAGNIQVIGSVLLVTDYASHVRDMMSLAKLVDVPSGNDAIYTIPVVHGVAKNLAAEVEPLLGTKFTVDERTNTLVLSGSPQVYERAKTLIERLDLELATDSGASIHVYQLGNAVAEEIAKTMNDGIQQLSLEGKAKVIADAKSNKLIVTASARDYLAIRDVLRQLDEPRRQVYIETLILEVQVSDTLDLGTAAHGGTSTGNGKGLMFGGVETTTLNTMDVKDSLAGASGLVGGLLGAPINGSSTLFGTSIPSYAVLFQALATHSNTNVVSAPSIIAVDNEATTFHVGQNVPYKKGTIPVTATSTAITTTNIDRQDLNLELAIKPHISSGDNVLLEIKHDSKELGDSSSDLGPSWTTRGFETRVVVRDQQTVVITGMTQERDVLITTKVPLLGDIPLLGHLFRYDNRTKKKSNLIVLLTPYIIKDQLDLQAIQERKQREHDEFVASFHSLANMRYMPQVDYRRKRGLVEEINRQVESVEQDAAARAELAKPPRVQGGPL